MKKWSPDFCDFMSDRCIVIRGAREHNLKNLNLSIPRDRLVVITGLSGSGKSSLAFDTIYAEGQRRYLESLSAYARQFLEQIRKPDVDAIDGLSPSISIEQKNLSHNPRSTVGTVTEIYDFLRLLYARVGILRCFSCGKPIQNQTIQQIVDLVLQHSEGVRCAILAPIVRGKRGEYYNELLALRSQGFIRAKIDGLAVDLATPPRLAKNFHHNISIYIDRLILKPGLESRLSEAVEIATNLADGLAEVEFHEQEISTRLFSTKFACVNCGTSVPEVEPRSFSFNSRYGACPQCLGLGMQQKIDPALVIPNTDISLSQGAIAPWAKKSAAWQKQVLLPLSEKFDFKLSTPFHKLSMRAQEVLLYGSADEEISFKTSNTSRPFRQRFEGVIPSLERKLIETSSWWEEYELEKYITRHACAGCNGARLKKEMLSVYFGGKNISEFCNMSIDALGVFLRSLELSPQQTLIAGPILKEIESRLTFLADVGLSYLTLSRSAGTLSGGEAQRIRLATQIGSNLVGVLYILDEPSIGLHQRDNDKLIQTLERLRDQGNSVLVVEHDAETIERADFVIDMGPGAGIHGGELVFVGSPVALKEQKKSLTGQYLAGEKTIPVPQKRRPMDPRRSLSIKKAHINNLKNIGVEIPLGTFACVTGVSGSGKSSLVIDTLLKGLELYLLGGKQSLSQCEGITGLGNLDKVVHVNQRPVGRTHRSNPATYTGTFKEIRCLFAALPDSRARGYKAGRFSFNVQGGRCEACGGDGTIRISMNFLPDVYVDCEVCGGKRYNRETMEVLYRGKSIAEVLSMTVEEAASFFERVPVLKEKLKTLLDVGLGYIHLGQNTVTLSGGEAQRIKLAKELSRRTTGRTLYVLDEPTTGLHFEDIRKLMRILHSLVDQGNTVIVIEHNLDVIKQADYIVDLGPDGGEAGGYVVFQGTPEELCKKPDSYTAKALAKVLLGKAYE